MTSNSPQPSREPPKKRTYVLPPKGEETWTEPAPLEVLVAFHGTFPWTSFDVEWLLDRQFSLRAHYGSKS